MKPGKKKLDITELNRVTDLLKRKKKKLYEGGLTQYGQTQGETDKMVEDAAESVPLWGGVFNATRGATDMIKGDGTDATTSAIASAFSPSSGVTTAADYGSNEDVLIAAFNPIAGGVNNARLMEEAEAKRQNSINAAIKGDAMSYAKGGQMLPDSAQLQKGGELKNISPDAVEVKATDPSKTDSVELNNAFVDDGEVIDRKARVYSDTLKLPTGKTVAKHAKQLEKMKSLNSRFEGANQHIDTKLDSLFNYQEAMKKPKGNMAFDSQNSLKKGGKIKAALGATIDPEDEEYWLRQKGDPFANHPFKNDEKPQFVNPFEKEPETDVLQAKGDPFKNHPFGQTSKVKAEGLNMAPASDASVKKGSSFDWEQAGTTAAMVAPNITNAFLQKRLKGPASPNLEVKNKLKKFTPDAAIASQNRLFNQAQTAIQRGTAQSSDLGAATGSLLAKRLAAQNETYGAVNNLNANIQNQEAQLNAGIGARNTERVNTYNQGVSDFINKKLQLTSENVANLSAKIQARGREKNQMDLDKEKYQILMSAYGDLPEEMRAKYAHLFSNEKIGKKKGGMIPTKLYRKGKC